MKVLNSFIFFWEMDFYWYGMLIKILFYRVYVYYLYVIVDDKGI